MYNSVPGHISSAMSSVLKATSEPNLDAELKEDLLQLALLIQDVQDEIERAMEE